VNPSSSSMTRHSPKHAPASPSVALQRRLSLTSSFLPSPRAQQPSSARSVPSRTTSLQRSGVRCKLPTALLAMLVLALVGLQSFRTWRKHHIWQPDTIRHRSFDTAAPVKNAPTVPLQQAQISQQRTLRFQVCNGFANQRLAVLYGVLIAHNTRRAVVLPSLIRSGLQKTTTQVTATESNTVSFESMYNSARFKSALKQHGVLVIEPTEAPPATDYTSVPLDYPDIMTVLSTQYAKTSHISIGCPLFRLPARHVEEAEQLAWAVLDNMTPSDSLQAYIDTVSARLQDLTLAVKYNFLHLRIEKDWQDHCRRWTAIKDGVVRDNCMNNTRTVDEQLQDKGISPELPLYIASHWPDSDHDEVARVRSKLQRYGFQLITSQDITYDARVDRESAALIDYFLALKSEHFIGNSVSTFSGLQLIERHHRGRWASYYNGGNTPLTDFLPLDPLPWVFTYNSWSSRYDYMLKAAVVSGVKV
jgi:hypothetical protein